MFFSTFGRNTKLQTSLRDKLEYGIHDQRDRLADSSNTIKDFQTEESMVIFHNYVNHKMVKKRKEK